MGKLLQSIVRRLAKWPFLLLALAIVIVELGVDIKFHQNGTAFLVAVVILAPLIAMLQLIDNLFLRRMKNAPSTEFVPESHLATRSICLASQLKGEIDIYNIELNTFTHMDIWKAFATAPAVTGVRIALAPHIFRRLEHYFTTQAEVKAFFTQYAGRFIFEPVTIDDAWRPDGIRVVSAAINDVSKSRQVPTLSKDTSAFAIGAYSGGNNEDGRRWRYITFVDSDDTTVVSPCTEKFAEVFPSGAGTSTFTVQDIETLVRGDGRPIEEIGRQHGLSAADIVALQRCVSPTAGVVTPNWDRQGTNVVAELTTDRGPCKLKITGSEPDSRKPLVLWLPPWKVPRWDTFTRPFDKTIQQDYVVAHLEYTQRSEHYTFSGAQHDIVEAVRWLASQADALGLDDTKFILIAVSVNAFLAAEVASQMPPVIGLGMIMPGVDLLDSVDNLLRIPQGTELFTVDFI